MLNTIRMPHFSEERAVVILQHSEIYLRSYPALIALAELNNGDALQQQRILSLAAYGWMPTIPKSFAAFNFIDDAREIDSHRGAVEFLQNLEEPLVNNSWIGTSKILHFIQPEHFPVWDSKVAARFRVVTANRRNVYFKYVEAVHKFDSKNPDATTPVADYLENELQYRPSSIRCIELNLFTP